MEMPSRPVAVTAATALAAAVIFAGEIKSGVSDAFDGVTGAAGELVSEAWDATGIPGTAHNAQDCYADTGVTSHTAGEAKVSFHRGEELDTAHLQELRKNCASYTGFLEELVQVGLIGATAAGAVGGALVLRRRVVRQAHS